MPKFVEIGDTDDPMDVLRDLHITSQDGDNDDDNYNDESRKDLIDIDEEEEDDEDDDQNPVSLGFLEKAKHNWSLLRQLFPSKAGGVPAWLDPENLPSGRSCVCDICGDPLQFVLQVYAPISDRESTFHRMSYLFMCPSMSCLLRDQHGQWMRNSLEALRSVKVFRCQLPQQNSFYSSNPPEDDGRDQPLRDGAALCSWCGTWKGDKVCVGCRRARYCSEKHQVMHWRSGHRSACQQLSVFSGLPDGSPQREGVDPAGLQKAASKSLWPEYKIIKEDESACYDETVDPINSASSLVSMSHMNDSMKSRLDGFEGDSDRRSWASFQVHIGKAPEQVLRYCRDISSRPLWPMSSGQPTKADIPKCSHCGGAMILEFQVMPQLLYYFGVKNDVDSLDWATIVVYTCEASCDGNLGYREEFAWVQLSSPSLS